MPGSLVLIAHNIRSAHNVGALLRTCEGLGVEKLYLTGYTPYPVAPDDSRLPHIARKLDKQISKISLGAEKTMRWEYSEDIIEVLGNLKKDGFSIAGLEQHKESTPLSSFRSPEKLAILLGSEVTGIKHELLKMTDLILEIPMAGRKESFNVVEAAAMAMYHCKHIA